MGTNKLFSHHWHLDICIPLLSDRIAEMQMHSEVESLSFLFSSNEYRVEWLFRKKKTWTFRNVKIRTGECDSDVEHTRVSRLAGIRSHENWIVGRLFSGLLHLNRVGLFIYFFFFYLKVIYHRKTISREFTKDTYIIFLIKCILLYIFYRHQPHEQVYHSGVS